MLIGKVLVRLLNALLFVQTYCYQKGLWKVNKLVPIRTVRGV